MAAPNLWNDGFKSDDFEDDLLSTKGLLNFNLLLDFILIFIIVISNFSKQKKTKILIKSN